MKSLRSLLLNMLLLIAGNIIAMEEKIHLGYDLHIALIQSDLEKAKSLINLGADLNIENPAYKQTPIIVALDRGFEEIAELLIKFNAKFDVKDKFQKTALSISCDRGYAKIAALLINAGSDINMQDGQGFTPLNCACYGILHRSRSDINKLNNYTNIIELLIKSGAKLNTKTKYNDTTFSLTEKLEIGSFIKNAQIKRDKIKILKEKLFKAIEICNLDEIKKLIKKGLTLNLYDQSGNNILHLALITPENRNKKIKNKERVISLILIYSKELNLIDKKNKFGLTPIELALSVGKFKALEILTKLAISKKKEEKISGGYIFKQLDNLDNLLVHDLLK